MQEKPLTDATIGDKSAWHDNAIRGIIGRIAGDVSAGHDIARYVNDIRGNNGQR